MSRVIYSPIISDIRGKAGTLVFSSWKGRSYIRKQVIPGNPNTADQQLIRAAFSRTVKCYQGLAADLKTFLDILGSDAQMSGFNIMMKSDVKNERDNKFGNIVPANTYVMNIEGFALSAPGASDTINVAWTVTGWTGAESPTFLYRRDLGPDAETPWTELAPTSGGADMTDSPAVLTLPAPTTSYVVCMVGEDASNNFSRGSAAIQISAT